MNAFNSTLKNLKTCIIPTSRSAGITMAVLCLVVTGCVLLKAKQDINKSLESTILVGRVYARDTGKGPIIVAACSKHKGKEIVHYTVLHESGEYELVVGQGDYYVFAFRDKNSNLVYEAGEPAGQYGKPTPVRAPDVGVVHHIDMEIPEVGGEIVIPRGTIISSIKPQKLYSRQAGAIADLDDERFSEEYGAEGFWEPISFFRQFGGNIYFLEKYDPQKIPILFIHGATGTPKGWKYFVDHIDRTRFQPWFFYYPTGARIDSMSYLLLWKLSNLQAKYQFNRMYITAHSMGGLVARSFIVNYGSIFPYIKLFISLATPWGGDKMAEYGVQQSPVVLPSWIDMQPESDFIKSLYRKKMPESVSFYMFYGYRGNRNPFSSNNDGTITLSSLLDARPQSEAEMNYAFNEDHASIIYSKEAVAQYNTILDKFDEKQGAALRRSGGYIKVSFEYNYDFEGVSPGHTLILRPMGKNGAETITFLNDGDNGRILGPFPSGDYYAALVTMAAKTTQKKVPVTIERNETKEVNFVFEPDGVIRGCVAASLEPEDKVAGMPDYRYRSVDRKITIQSITLQGNGIRRTPRPIQGEDTNDPDYAILRNDICYNQCFAFFGLPAGEYKLTIQAQDYKTKVMKYSVTPGIPKNFRVTELEPD